MQSGNRLDLIIQLRASNWWSLQGLQEVIDKPYQGYVSDSICFDLVWSLAKDRPTWPHTAAPRDPAPGRDWTRSGTYKTRYVNPVLFSSWAGVTAIGPTLKQHWADIDCRLAMA